MPIQYQEEFPESSSLSGPIIHFKSHFEMPYPNNRVNRCYLYNILLRQLTTLHYISKTPIYEYTMWVALTPAITIFIYFLIF